MHPLDAGDPRTLGEYRLLRRIGAGGMGRVYLGRSPGGRTVAVKAVHPHFAADAEFRVRFRREVESARRVGGAWTAPVLDADPDAAVPWVATGYVAGPSLQQAVAEHGPMPEPTVRVLGAGLAEALGAVHALGLLHRDVKPSNVLLTLDGPRLIDFGIARATDGTTGLTSTGASIGSPGYMSPEQVLGRGGVAAPSDVFSLGAVLAFAATGSAPFRGDGSAVLLYNVVHEEPDLPGLADGELRQLVEGCLAKRAVDRPSPEDVVRVLAGETAGPAALTHTGWLPGPLVEQVSRSAVALLDMEGEATAATSAEGGADDGAPASGLVPFPDAPVQDGGDAATRPDEPAGLAVVHPPPPEVPAAQGEPDRARRAAEQRESAERQGPYASAALPEGPDAVPVPGPAVQQGRTGRGRVSVSASATSGVLPGAGGGRSARQVSCALVLSVAGALTAVLLTLTVVFDLVPGGGTDDSAEPPAAAQSPSGDELDAAPTEGEPTGGLGPDSVPDAFLGTWKGQLTTEDGLPAGLLRVTVRSGEAGDTVITGSFTVAIVGDVCPGRWRLRDATERKLTTLATSSGDGERCAGGSRLDEFRLLPAGGGLRYETDGGLAGTLRKTD